MKLLFITIFIIVISGCGGGEDNDSIKYPQTENKPSKSQDTNWGKGAWDNLKWK